MMQDLLALKLHVDASGNVWYIYANELPVATNLSIIDFLLSPLCREFAHFRLAGLRQNLPLIVALYCYPNKNIEVCSPLICRTEKERRNPSRMLYAMRQCVKAPSLGGWAKLNADWSIGLLLPAWLDKVKHIDDYARQLLSRHPAWLPLSFIPHLDLDACIRLLSLIIDPRWFINPINPTRGSQLRKYLGLDLKTMQCVCDKTAPQRYQERCQLVMDAWHGTANMRLVERPDYFVWRVHHAILKKTDNEVLANLRASQMFVEYLRLTWLATLGRGRHQNEALFVPDYFFQEKYEAKAFSTHIRNIIGKER